MVGTSESEFAATTRSYCTCSIWYSLMMNTFSNLRLNRLHHNNKGMVINCWPSTKCYTHNTIESNQLFGKYSSLSKQAFTCPVNKHQHYCLLYVEEYCQERSTLKGRMDIRGSAQPDYRTCIKCQSTNYNWPIQALFYNDQPKTTHDCI